MEQLGVEPVQLATQVFNFVVMAILLTRFLYKPILKALKDRRDKIAEGLAYTEKAQKEAEKTEKRREEILADAKEEAAGIIEDAKKSGKLQEAEIIARSHEEAKTIIEKGRADIVMEREHMQKSVRDQMTDVAAAIAAKAIESTLTGSQHRIVIGKKIRMIAKQLS